MVTDGIGAIARELGLACKTVRRYLRDASGPPPRYGPRPERPSTLDPYKADLRRRVAEAHPRWIPATVLGSVAKIGCGRVRA